MEGSAWKWKLHLGVYVHIWFLVNKLFKKENFPFFYSCILSAHRDFFINHSINKKKSLHKTGTSIFQFIKIKLNLSFC
jgi:hypothetical protein